MNKLRAKASAHNASGRLRYRRYGVYDVAYEDAPSPLAVRVGSLLDGLGAVYVKTSHVKRLLADAVRLAPVAFATYMLTTVWRGVHWAVHLYWLTVLFDSLGYGLVNRAQSPAAYQSLAASWLCCAMINVPVGFMHARSLEILTKRFRAYFIPQLIRASLRVDLLSIQDLYSVFPVQGRFGSEFPGGRFLMQLSLLVQRTLDLISQAYVLLRAISCKQSPEREILLCLCVLRGLLCWMAPPNGIGSSAYVYWPNNRHFQRMKALFGLAFSTQYRADLMLDGMVGSIEAKYRESEASLGDVEVLEPSPSCTDLWRDWYWDFLMGITLDNPLAIYVLIFSAHLSPSSISSMVLLQQATASISLSISQYINETPSLRDVCSHAQWLYEAIDHQGTITSGTEPFPRPNEKAYDAGMKITFRNVSLRYPGCDRDALRDVSFEILPGELVLVVGTNGSGKSSLLKLLARLFDPTAGDVLIDDVPLVRYDVDQLRAAMAFQSQSAVVYPVSVRENITFGLPPPPVRQCDDDDDDDVDDEPEHVHAAARTGGCAEWIARLDDGYDARLRPSFDVHNGWIEGMYGFPSETLKEALARHEGGGGLVSLSGGEKQRLATARTLLRIHACPTRLLVVDEATSALDPIAERTILTAFRAARTGKTVVIVTHRFQCLAHHADRILCIKDGRVVENGTHAQLVNLDGEYTALYRAQIARSD